MQFDFKNNKELTVKIDMKIGGEKEMWARKRDKQNKEV